jgi:serine phosphatase RsbU (regulator of sigma subunit)
MKFLHRILPAIICIIFIFQGFALLWFGEQWFMKEFVKEWPILSALAILLWLPAVYFIVYKAYIKPIQALNRNISRFMTGIDEEPDLVADTWSLGMNNVISFFIKSLQILRVFKQELRDGRKLRSEVEIASEIQKHVIANEETIVPSLEIAIGSVPASEVGWDSLDIIPGRNGNYYIYIGDVTGHGVPSGFVMMMVNALVSAFVVSEESSARVMTETNRILKPRIKQNMMMSSVMLRWNDTTKSLYYTGAGHEFILIYSQRENKVFKIKSWWVALGMVRDAGKLYKEQQIRFEPEDVVILYTDGITEARYHSEQNWLLFGIDRIVESIMKTGNKTAENIFKQITIDLSAHMGYKHKQYDDITLMVARYNKTWSGSTVSNLPDMINPTNITEWNWWRKSQITL